MEEEESMGDLPQTEMDFGVSVAAAGWSEAHETAHRHGRFHVGESDIK